MKPLVELATKLADSPQILIIVLGIFAFILGAAGGISYQNWLVFPEGLPRYATMAVGALVVLTGVVAQFVNPAARKPYGIIITAPTRNQTVTTVRVEGKIRRFPPSRYRLWLLRMYENGDIIPMREVNLSRGRDEWSVSNIGVGAARDETRIIVAALAGPASQYLFKYFRDAAVRHNQWMDELKIEQNVKNRWLPNFDQKLMEVMDIIECDRVEVKPG